jgi:Met-zincin
LKDISVTSQLGTMASVMDYSALNMSTDETKRGNYYCIRPGPYDKWAIEYGYTQCKPEEEAAVLAKIASRSSDPHLVFGNDADIAGFGSGIDPRVQVWDMSNDMVAYAEDRYKLVNQLIPKLKDKYVKPDQSYAELMAHYNYINRDRFTMSMGLSRYIGGIYVDRSFPDQQSGNKPFTVVSVEYQKKALGVISKYVFAPHAFDADAYLFPYLQRQRRGFDFFGTTENPKPQNLVLAIQGNVLAFLLYPASLQRINTSSLYGNSYSVADVMGDLTTAIFKEDLKTNVNLYRQNLQTEYVRRLVAIVSAPPGAYDYPSVAAAVSTLRKIKLLLASAVSSNEQTRAHRANLVFLIDKALVIK